MAVPQPSRRRIERHWRILCEDIGIRLAGSSNEAQAADYIQQEFAKAGLVDSHCETFDCQSLQDARATVEIKDDGQWHAVDARALVGVPSTPDARPVSGELVWLDMPEAGHRLCPGSLTNKIAAVFGPLPTSVDLHKALIAARPLAVIHIDERLPFDWPKNDGTFPEWSRRYGMPTIVTVPYTDAWRWRQRGLKQVRINATVVTQPGTSQNVVADLPGDNPRAGMIILGAHHDTQCHNVGADDNASGVVALLELAQMLKSVPRKRTIRFVSFGTEEQLSVGSRAYALRHRDEMSRTAVMFNFDSVASPLGHTLMFCSGDAKLESLATTALRNNNYDVRPTRDVEPFSDHFCFTVFGVPALWFYRINFTGCRWQHHSSHDNLDNVSSHELMRLLSATGPLIHDVSQRSRLPFSHGYDPTQKDTIINWADSLFGIKPTDIE